MDLELQGRTAIVTGGGVGIGRALAETLAREGVDVAICARNLSVLEKTAGAISAVTGRRILPVQADVTEWSSIERLVETTVRELGRVDILVNCAAAPGGLVRNDLEEASDAALLHDIDTKVVGYFRCTKAVAPHMRRNHWGRIINVGGLTARSTEAISGLRNSAIIHLTKTLSDQLGPFGITVNVVHPGITRTAHVLEMYADLGKKKGITGEEMEARDANETPIRRTIEPEEIGWLVAFLASPRAAAITGESIAIDGGYTRGIYA